MSGKLQILQQDHTCPKCGHKWHTNTPINTDEWDGFDQEVKHPWIQGGAYGAGCGAAVGTLLAILMIAAWMLRFFFWLIGFNAGN